MPDSEHREDYAAEHEHAERVTKSVKKEQGHGEDGTGSGRDEVTPQLRKRDDRDE